MKGCQGERVRLYVQGTVLGYKRSKSNQYPNTSLIQIEGVNTQEEVDWYKSVILTCGSTKYTDKWAERWVGDGWDKWEDKWDENFNPSAQGVKQGETWCEGKHGERWNRSWGEGHNGSGWVHKYGKSSSGEHWDTHVPQETWYERFPHFGFFHCFDNSVQLRAVKKPSDMS